MLSRRSLLLAAAGAALAAPAFAADDSARAFVTAIYAKYKGKNTKGVPLGNDRAVRRYFAPPLAAMMIKDMNAAAKRNEVGALDGDPFIDAQGWEIKDFDIAVTENGPDKATATVKFKNSDEAKTIVLDLVKLKKDWRISEITTLRDGKKETLSSLFKK